MSRIRGVGSSSIVETVRETDVIFHPSATAGVAVAPSGFGIETRMRPSSEDASS
jgi:hypothetical protein